MRYFFVFLLTFLILVPTALAQDDDWQEVESDNFTFQLPPEWDSVRAQRGVEGEILAFERSQGDSRLTIVMLPMDGSVNDEFRREKAQEIEGLGGNVQDS